MNQEACFIPDKSWFKIDEVCTITGVREYIIRFWEKEFAKLGMPEHHQPKNFYSRKDIETILCIKSLLFDKKLTVDEAKIELDGMDSLPPKIKIEEVDDIFLNSEEASNDEVVEVHANYGEHKEQIAFLSSKLGSILRITDNVKSVHNWH